MDKQRHNVEYLKISQIETFETELKETDNLLLEKMKKSIAKYGQLKNIVVCNKSNETYQCIEGAKVLRCMKDLGYNEIQCINVGDVDEKEMKLMRISISRDYFLTNYVLLGEILKDIITTHKIEDICNIIPFTIRQANKMIDMTEFDWEDLNSSKQIEGQQSIFDLLEFEGDDYKTCSEQETIVTEYRDGTIEVDEEVDVFAEVIGAIVDEIVDAQHENETTEVDQNEQTTEVKDWKDVVYEESKDDEPQGFFAELEFEVAETKDEKVKEEFNDLPWDDEEVKVEEPASSTLPFELIERPEFSFLKINAYKDELIDLCKQLATQYIKHKYKLQIIEVEVMFSKNTDDCIVEYIQCVSEHKVKMTVRVQNIYDSIVEIYEL
jgi:hypothetical protein